MNERVSASSLTTRVRAEDLTDMEREAAKARGLVGPEGFLDIEKSEPAQMVDLKADVRKKAAADLKSVTAGPSPKPVTETSADVAMYTKEIGELQDKLRSRSPCPRCGLGIGDTCEVKPSPGDIEEFLKCVLAGQAFAKTYKVFGGALSVTLTTRSGGIDECIRLAVTDALRSKELLGETDVFAMIRQFTLAASLKRYTSSEVNLSYPELPGTPAEFRKAATERMAGIPAPVQNVLRTLMTDFNLLVDLMTARAQDPSFWVGTPA